MAYLLDAAWLTLTAYIICTQMVAVGVSGQYRSKALTVAGLGSRIFGEERGRLLTNLNYPLICMSLLTVAKSTSFVFRGSMSHSSKFYVKPHMTVTVHPC